ncbi:MAG: OmpA family protein [Methylophaga sp.]|nr:OmpA family protein [Methylophaga sp.]
MRLNVIIVLLLALIWGVGSWKWYTCNIKGFCGVETVAVDKDIVIPATVVPTTAIPVLVANIDLDSDGDGLSDKEEKRLGTNPNNSDSDGDGFSDRKEIGRNALTARDTDKDGVIDALDDDDDNDGLLTKVEALLATSAYSADSDNDGLSDSVEVGSDPRDPLDSDNDGLIDAVDYDDDDDGIPTVSEQADPNSDGNPSDAVDTDKDGIVDYLDADTNTDRDNDGLSNAFEAMLGTNPENSDTDGDGIPDGEEVGADSNKPTDLNGNGVIDALEAYVYTAPEAVAYVAPKQVEIVIEQDQRARVHFPFNNSDSPILSTETETYFTNLIVQLKAGSSVRLTGHTDDVGGEEINLKLALDRAEMIKGLLIERGAPADNISTDTKGESQPLQSNDTELGRGTNRRVELVTTK